MKLLFYVFIALPQLAFAQPLKSIFLNNDGTKDLKEQRISMAQQNYLKALSESPDNYVARLNLGVAFVFNEEIDKARKEFEIPLRATNTSPEIRYLAHFNAGRAYHQEKKTDEALKHYQDSLKYQKDSLQAKANIELLVQQQMGQGQGGSGDEEQDQNPKDQDQENQGGGKDDNKEQQDPKDGENEKEKEKPNKPQDLSDKDIEKILEELKNQEQKIRALEYGKKQKEDPNGKTW